MHEHRCCCAVAEGVRNSLAEIFTSEGIRDDLVLQFDNGSDLTIWFLDDDVRCDVHRIIPIKETLPPPDGWIPVSIPDLKARGRKTSPQHLARILLEEIVHVDQHGRQLQMSGGSPELDAFILKYEER